VYQVKRRHSILPSLVQVIEQKLVKYVDYILTVDSVNNELYLRFKKLNENVIVLQNAPSIKDFDIKARKKVWFKEGFEHKVVTYVGGISKDKGIFKMLEAIKEVKQDVPDVKLVIAGLLSDVARNSVTQFINSNKLEENVEFLGYVDYEKVPSLLKASTVGLILYQPTSWHLRSKASSKLFLYMTASIPVIVSDFPGFREIVDKANCGVLVNPSDVYEISKSIINLLTDAKLAQQLGKNGRKAVITGYNWEKEERKLMGVYELM
jgi:glycosyltransferase involved in cell wall biosynthesis